MHTEWYVRSFKCNVLHNYEVVCIIQPLYCNVADIQKKYPLNDLHIKGNLHFHNHKSTVICETIQGKKK